MPAELPEIIDDVAFATSALGAARARARAEAVAAIRGMERAMVDALAGECLRGMREMAPGYAAVRARATSAKEKCVAEPLPEPRPGDAAGRWVLVVASDGVLEMARSVRRPGRPLGYETRPAEDADLLVEDVEHLARLFARLTDAHVERARESAARFGELEDVARRISAALVA